MEITLNGQAKTVGEGITVHGLLNLADLDPARKGIAVAVNLEVLPRSQWASTRLETGDRVDVIRAVQGG